MAVMTVSTLQASQSYQSSISTQDGISPVASSQTLRNKPSLKSLLANSASRSNSTRSPPPAAVPSARNVSFIPPPPPPPLSMDSPSESPRFDNQGEPTTTSSASNLPPTTPLRTGGSISAVSSPVRPSPRFHVANPTEDPSSPPPPSRKASLSKAQDASRPLPTPNVSGTAGSELDNSSDIGSRSPSPPFIHINTNLRAQPTYYHSHSSPSTTNTTSPSPFSSAAASSIATSVSSTSSMGFVAPKPLTRVSLPIGPLPTQLSPVVPLADPQTTYSGRSTPVSSSMASSATSVSPRGRLRPLPIPPPLSAAPPTASTSTPLSGPRPRSYSRGPKGRSRANSSAGRGGGDANARPQLSFDPTSSSYVIKTSNSNSGSVSNTASMKPRRNGPSQTHARSRSAQFNSFSAMGSPSPSPPPDANSIAIAAALAGVGVGGSAHPTIGSFNGGATNANLPTLSAKQKGKLPIRSAPCSDTEDSPAASPLRVRRFAVVNDVSESGSIAPMSEKRKGKQPIRSAPGSDTEGFPSAWISSKQEQGQGVASAGYPVSSWKGGKKEFGKRSESVGSVSRVPYSTSQHHPHPLPNPNKPLSIITDFSSPKLAAPQSAHAAYSSQNWVPPQGINVQPLNIVRRTATPPNTNTGAAATIVNGTTKTKSDSPPPSIANTNLVHTVEEDTEDDIGYADVGYIDDDRVYVDDGFDGASRVEDLGLGDIGEITFSDNPPSPIWVDSTAEDTSVSRGRVKGRGRRRNTPTRRLGSYDSSIYNSQQGHGDGDVRRSFSIDGQEEERARQGNGNETTTSPVGYDPVNVDIELEGEMIFSKNQSPINGYVGERVFMRGKWRSPSPPTPVMRRGGALVPVRPRHFFEDSSRH